MPAPKAPRDQTGDMIHVAKRHNGEKSWSPFSAAEMTRRQNDMRRHMAASNVDACLFTSYHSICYYSGFLYCYFGRKYGLVLDQNAATTVTAAIDGGQPYRRSFGDNITYSDWRKDNYFTAVRGLLPKGTKRLGIEFDHVNLDLRRDLETAFPGIELVDCAQPAMWMRAIKSAEEHAHIRDCARICNVGATAVMGGIAAGVPEYEVALASNNAMVREIGTSFPFVELMDTWTWFQSGIMLPEGRPGAGGYREHDIFIVGETGAENITNFPYGPEHMIVGKGGRGKAKVKPKAK